MKIFATVTAFALGLATTPALANDLSFGGKVEYATEAEVFELEAGAEYGLGDFTLGATALFDDATDGDFSFTGTELQAGYAVTEQVEAYVRLELDEDFNDDEVVVGAAFRF